MDTITGELKKQTEENADLRKELDELVIGCVDPQKLKTLELEDSIDQHEIEPKPVSLKKLTNSPIAFSLLGQLYINGPFRSNLERVKSLQQSPVIKLLDPQVRVAPKVVIEKLLF